MSGIASCQSILLAPAAMQPPDPKLRAPEEAAASMAMSAETVMAIELEQLTKRP